MFQNGKKFGVLFALGAVILVLGLAFQWYPTSVIDGLEETLKDTTLTATQRTAYQEALNSRRILQITILQPLSSVLFAVGLITIVYAVISGIFSISSSYRVVKKGNEKGS